MKTLFNSIKKLLGTVVSVLTFGLIKMNDNLTKNCRVKMLRVKKEDLVLEDKKIFDKTAKLEGDKRVVIKEIYNISKDLTNIKDKLVVARDTNNKVLFTELSNDYKDKDAILQEKNEILTAFEEALGILNNESKVIQKQIKSITRTINKIEAKQATYETIKGVNEVLGDMKKNTTDKTSVEELVEDLDNDVIRESAKAELIRKDMIVEDEPIEFNNEQEMDEFLKSIS